jgi:hypothetical protein
MYRSLLHHQPVMWFIDKWTIWRTTSGEFKFPSSVSFFSLYFRFLLSIPLSLYLYLSISLSIYPSIPLSSIPPVYDNGCHCRVNVTSVMITIDLLLGAFDSALYPGPRGDDSVIPCDDDIVKKCRSGDQKEAKGRSVTATSTNGHHNNDKKDGNNEGSGSRVEQLTEIVSLYRRSLGMNSLMNEYAHGHSIPLLPPLIHAAIYDCFDADDITEDVVMIVDKLAALRILFPSLPLVLCPPSSTRHYSYVLMWYDIWYGSGDDRALASEAANADRYRLKLMEQRTNSMNTDKE